MTRYYFHLFDQIWHLDREGHELPDRQAARSLTIGFARDLIRERPEVASPLARVRLEVEDENGETFLVLKFVDVVEEPGEAPPSPASSQNESRADAGGMAEAPEEHRREDMPAEPGGEVADQPQAGTSGQVEHQAPASPATDQTEERSDDRPADDQAEKTQQTRRLASKGGRYFSKRKAHKPTGFGSKGRKIFSKRKAHKPTGLRPRPWHST